MEFELTEKNCIIAVLSSQDLYSMGLCYNDIDYSNEKTRIALGDILSKGKMYMGDAEGFLKKIRIDVLPREDNGCVIFFTDLEKDSEDTPPNINVFFSSKSFDSVLDLAKALNGISCREHESSLYKGGETYYLRVQNPSDAALSVCAEFMLICPNEGLLFERIKEISVCLIKSDALKVLCSERT